MAINPWTFVGASTVVETTATGHTLTLPAGTQDGDLLVAVIASRIASTTAITLPSGWTLVNQQRTNNVVAAASTGIASCMMAYIVRGASAPALGFTHPVAPSVAQGQIVAYRGAHLGTGGVPTLEATAAFTTATGVTAVSGAGLTSIDCVDLVVMGVAGGRAAAWSNFDAVTRPGTGSGTGGQTGAPIFGTWQERADTQTTTGADTSLGIADGLMDIASATGNLSVTASLSGGHAVCAGAFRAGFSEIKQTGSTLRFANISSAASGTVSSTITVPADATMVAVGLSSYAATAGWFTNFTFTKGGVDTPMVKVGSNDGVLWAGGLYYMMLPDTGTNKTLKWSFGGTHNANNLVSVTFWKGLHTLGVGNSGWSSNSGAPWSVTFTSVDNRMTLAWTTAFCTASGTEGSVTQWVNGIHHEEVVHSLEADGAWGKAYPSGGSSVIGVNTETGWDDGTVWLLELIPASQGISATMAETEDPDVAALTGTVATAGVTGTLGEIEDPDVAALTGMTGVFGTVAETEDADVFAATGQVGKIVQVGSVLTFPNLGTANTGTVSTTINVPADATMIAVGISAAHNSTPYYNRMTFTKGGVDTDMTLVATGDAANWCGALFVQTLPDTGANKTLKWDWAGTATADYGDLLCSVTFWKGVNTSAPLRSTATGGFGGPPYHATVAETRQHDLVLMWATGGCTTVSIEGTANVWSNGSLIADVAHYNFADGAWGRGTPTAGTITSTTYGLTSTVVGNSWQDGSIFIGVLQPTADPIGATLNTSEAPDVLAATGAVSWQATLAETEDPDVLAATGAVNWQASLATTEAVDVLAATGVVRWAATLATIETADTAALTGSVTWAATLATTESVDVAAMTGAVAWNVTLAAPEAADVAALAGAVRWAATLATTEAPDVAAFTGGVTWNAVLATVEAPDGAAFTGTAIMFAALATTELADAASFTGAVSAPSDGTFYTVEAPDVGTFTGAVSWVATLAAPEPADVGAFTGSVLTPVAATLATVEAPDVAALTGTIRWVAVLATSEAADVAAFTAAVSWAGTLATTEGPDSAALAGVTRWAATLTATETADAGAFTGAVRWIATLAAVEPADSVAFTGGIFASGPLATTEAPDTVAFTGGIVGTGVLATREAADTYAGTGIAFGEGISVFLVAVEPPDIAALTGQVTGVAGTLAAREAEDTYAGAGTVRTVVTLAATEAPDVAAFTGGIYATGTLATTEARDVAAFLGASRWVVTLAASEAPDVAAFSGIAGALAESVAFAVTEAPDLAAFTGTTTNIAVLDTREAPDDLTFIVTFRSFGPLDAVEAPDGMLFVEAPVSIQESPGYILSRDQARVRVLANSNERVRLLKYPIPRPRELVNTLDQRIRDLSGRRTRVLARD